MIIGNFCKQIGCTCFTDIGSFCAYNCIYQDYFCSKNKNIFKEIIPYVKYEDVINMSNGEFIDLINKVILHFLDYYNKGYIHESIWYKEKTVDQYVTTEDVFNHIFSVMRSSVLEPLCNDEDRFKKILNSLELKFCFVILLNDLCDEVIFSEKEVKMYTKAKRELREKIETEIITLSQYFKLKKNCENLQIEGRWENGYISIYPDFIISTSFNSKEMKKRKENIRGLTNSLKNARIGNCKGYNQTIQYVLSKMTQEKQQIFEIAKRYAHNYSLGDIIASNDTFYWDYIKTCSDILINISACNEE